MKLFRNLKIAHKLLIAFLVTGLMTAALGGFAYLRLKDLNAQIVDVSENWVPAVRALLAMKSDFLEMRTRQLAMLNAKDEKELEEFIAGAKENRETFMKHKAEYVKTIESDEERKLWAAVETPAQAYLAEHEKAVEAARKGDKAALAHSIQGASRDHRRAFIAALAIDITFNEAAMAKAMKSANDRYASAVVTISVGTGLAITAALLLGWFIARVITRPLGVAVDVSRAVSHGDLGRKIEVNSKDETGQLLEAMKGMVGTLNAFSAAQKDVAAKHEAGETAATIDASKFEGSYREMAEGVNELAAGHIRVMNDTMAIVGEYAQGNLVRDMAELPGERAKITAAIATVKSNLTAINGEILKLTSAASHGDFTARGDAGRFEHDFRKMIEGLNGLMEVADRGLSDVAKTLASIAKGDLTARIDADYEGTFGELKDNSNETASQLGQIVAQIREAAESISTASGEIAQGNADLSQRTEEQASSLQQTAASMEELTSTVKQNAENAKQANQLAVSASGVATQGGQVVSQVVETMGAISESAKKIADIITVIDGIAFQTNILALNAAVEAARAGEQGRGFAVVAGEVRTLAQRSAEAAKEIKSLIGNSVEKVDAGSKLVNDAGQTMDEVVKSVKRVADIISEITAASQEQSAGIEQVNQAITQMDQVTQQNAALVEQAAAAAESMREQASSLTTSVSVFRVDGKAALGAPKSVAKLSAPKAVKSASKPAAKPSAKALPPARASRPAVEKDGDWKEF
ncbi:hypothetical protein BWI17_17790 [Betaproteobacteria bacterium GR16-43]|nr:hypothetical protein BWI17_17790 [Betaproteobacteria bacterium GR16-43]